MSTDHELDVLFQSASDDVGCSAGFELLHRYVEEELAGRYGRSHLPRCCCASEDLPSMPRGLPRSS